MGRIYPPRPCKYCGHLIRHNNIYRHIDRLHKDLIQKAKGEVSILPEATRVQYEVEDEDEADDVPIDVLKDCVINMFRQANLRSIPALSGYLGEYYPEVPACMRIPIIVSAYTAAQKVALTHDDIKDGQDVERAKQSMARWRHGLSAIAPTKEQSHRSTATSRTSSISSLRRSQDPCQTVACSTPLSLFSPISNMESPCPEMTESSSVIPTSSGGNLEPLSSNELLTKRERQVNQLLMQPATDAVESEQTVQPLERGSEDDPVTADYVTPRNIAVTPAHVKMNGEQPAHDDILARAVQVILSPINKGKKRKYNVGVLKKKKNFPKQYQLDDPLNDVEPYSPSYIAPKTTRVNSDEGWKAPIHHKDTFELSASDSMIPSFGPPVEDVLTSVGKEQISSATFVPMPNCDYDEIMGNYSVSFAKDVIPVTAMESVSPPGMEGKTIALTSHTDANETCGVFEPDVMLHWNDLELSTDSTEALIVGAEPSSDILNTPLIQHLNAETKGSVLPRHVVYRKSEGGKGIKNKKLPHISIGHGASVDNPTLTGGVKVKPVAVTLPEVQRSGEELKSLIASVPRRMSNNITMSKNGVVRSRPDTVEEVLPVANPDSVTTNTSRSVPTTNVTIISIPQPTCVVHSVTSSTTRMSSTVSSSLMNGTLSSARSSSGKRMISFASRHDRVKGICHHASGRSREESAHLLNTSFRIPLLSRENKSKEKRRHKESSGRHPLKYPCNHLESRMVPSRRTQLLLCL